MSPTVSTRDGLKNMIFCSVHSKKVCYQVFLADTSEKSLFFMNIGA